MNRHPATSFRDPGVCISEDLPDVRLKEGPGILVDLVVVPSAGGYGFDEARVKKDGHVMGQGGLRYVHVLENLAGAQSLSLKNPEDAKAVGIGQCAHHAQELLIIVHDWARLRSW